MSTLASRLRWAREAAELTQRGLARLAGLKCERHVGLIEDGTRPNVLISTLIVLAKALGVSLDWLGNGEGPRPSSDTISRHVRKALREEPPRRTGTDN